jgi:hypothetical protein
VGLWLWLWLVWWERCCVVRGNICLRCRGITVEAWRVRDCCEGNLGWKSTAMWNKQNESEEDRIQCWVFEILVEEVPLEVETNLPWMDGWCCCSVWFKIGRRPFVSSLQDRQTVARNFFRNCSCRFYFLWSMVNSKFHLWAIFWVKCVKEF